MDQKLENILNLALETPEEEREQTESLNVGYSAESRSWELIVKYHGSLDGLREQNIVVDPVMVSTSGTRLIQDEAVEILKKELFPLAELITPNIPEAEVLTGFDIRTAEDMEKAAEKICETYHCSVLLKGGHQVHTANDILCSEAGKVWFNGKRIDNPNTHGTGCTLSSAIASNLANNMPLREAVGAAKEYISAALADMLDLGRGSGPMNHGFALCKKNP